MRSLHIHTSNTFDTQCAFKSQYKLTDPTGFLCVALVGGRGKGRGGVGGGEGSVTSGMEVKPGVVSAERSGEAGWRSA